MAGGFLSMFPHDQHHPAQSISRHATNVTVYSSGCGCERFSPAPLAPTEHVPTGDRRRRGETLWPSLQDGTARTNGVPCLQSSRYSGLRREVISRHAWTRVAERGRVVLQLACAYLRGRCCTVRGAPSAAVLAHLKIVGDPRNDARRPHKVAVPHRQPLILKVDGLALDRGDELCGDVDSCARGLVRAESHEDGASGPRRQLRGVGCCNKSRGHRRRKMQGKACGKLLT